MCEDGLSRPLPTIEPGEIWVIEHDPVELSIRDCAVLSSANVVLYDRVLAGFVAQRLPLGAYAEPLPPTSAAAGPAIAPRALAFAGEGWRVVQLVGAGRAWRARLPIMPPALIRAQPAGGPLIRVIANGTSGAQPEIGGTVDEIAKLIRSFHADERLTVVIGPLVAHRRVPVPAHAFTANGLAG